LVHDPFSHVFRRLPSHCERSDCAAEQAVEALGKALAARTMNPKVAFHYELTGRGWSECRLAIGDLSCEVTASYLSDALGDLASAVENCLRGHTVARVSFVEEPGEYRWVFSAATIGRLRVRIVEFPEWSKRSDAAGKIIFDAECDRRELGQAVAEDMRRLLDARGAAGYRELWAHGDFPMERLVPLSFSFARAAANQ
jgi:hypothetical protein